MNFKECTHRHKRRDKARLFLSRSIFPFHFAERGFSFNDARNFLSAYATNRMKPVNNYQIKEVKNEKIILYSRTRFSAYSHAY